MGLISSEVTEPRRSFGNRRLQRNNSHKPAKRQANPYLPPQPKRSHFSLIDQDGLTYMRSQQTKPSRTVSPHRRFRLSLQVLTAIKEASAMPEAFDLIEPIFVGTWRQHYPLQDN